jgi:hypothetical protein
MGLTKTVPHLSTTSALRDCIYLKAVLMFFHGYCDDRQYVVNLDNGDFFQVLQSTPYASPRSVPFYKSTHFYAFADHTLNHFTTNQHHSLTSVFEGGKLLEMTRNGSIGTISPL